MRALFASFLGYFLNPAGLLVLAVLDSSPVFFLPLGIDFVVIVLSARQPERFWLYAVAATVGSVAGAAATYWLGRKVGEAGLSRWVGPSRLERVQHQVRTKAAAAVAALGIIPPPLPFTAIVLASGAFALDAWRFFSTLTAVRLSRFMVESALAARYGRRLLVWMDSTIFEVLVGLLVVVAVGGTILSAMAVIRGAHRKQPASA